MRRLIAFPCAAETLVGALDDAPGDTGVLMVTGGSQTRYGSHRMYERLAKHLAEQGFSCFRYDRRGVGDSSGEDPGYRGSAEDVTAAAQAFRDGRPGLQRIIGFGLCDGATALMLHGEGAELAGIVAANPWMVEVSDGAPAPAAIKARYREQLLSVAGWKRLLGGKVSYRKLFTGVLKIVRPQRPANLAQDVAASVRRGGWPIVLLLASRDNTAVAAEAEVGAFRQQLREVVRLDSDSHTFAKTGDEQALHAAVLKALEVLSR